MSMGAGRLDKLFQQSRAYLQISSSGRVLRVFICVLTEKLRNARPHAVRLCCTSPYVMPIAVKIPNAKC
jgi:hypothetical protein